MASATDKPRARRRGAMEERSMVMDRMMIRYGVLAQDNRAENRVQWCYAADGMPVACFAWIV
jgi:hypothetical protein